MSLAVPWFVLSIVLVTRLPELLPVAPFLPGLPIALYGLYLRCSIPFSAFYLGFVFTLMIAQNGLTGALPVELENRVLEVEGRVVNLPVREEGIERFRFRVDSVDGCKTCWTGLVNLSWYRSPIVVRPGDYLRLSVKLSNPRASLNPGLFDYEGWLFFHKIRATGYVKDSEHFELIANSRMFAPHHTFRWHLRDKILQHLKDSPVKGLIVALVIGESGQISSAHWRSLTKTGTNHLLIISGLHVGLVAAIIFRVLSLLPIPIRWIGVFTGLFVAVYAFVAGFGLPVQRALIMTSVVLFAVCANRRITLPTMFSASLLGVVLMQPFAVMSTGFWLSFGAVFALLFAFGGRVAAYDEPSLPSIVVTAVSTQWIVFITMFPVLLYLVYQVSLVGFLVNLIAIPFVSLLVIPWLLLFVVLSNINEVLAGFVLQISEFFLSIIWDVINWFAGLNWMYQGSAQGLLPVMIIIAGTYILLVPKGLMPKWLAIFCLLPILTPQDRLAVNEILISFIDVGQGLSVLVRTRRSALLYDAGPSYGDRFDSGEQIVTPVLRRQGVKALDTLIISHGDNDHSGGADSIKRNFNPTRVFGHGTAVSDCDTSVAWIVDGIRFEVFRLKGVDFSDNDRSCLLLVTAPGFAVLLTGDIEGSAEVALRQQVLPPVNVVLVPHHGSRTSSGAGFINQVETDLAIVSAGYQNRFGHPDAGVMGRYAVRQVKVLNTATAGAISILLGDRGIKRISRARSENRRFWHKSRIKDNKKGKY